MKQLNTKETLKRVVVGSLFLIFGGLLIGLGGWISGDNLIVFQWVSYALRIAGVLSFLMGLQLIYTASNMIDNKSFTLSYQTEKKSPILIGSETFGFSINPPEWVRIKGKKNKYREISKLDQTFNLTRVNGIDIENKQVPGWFVYKFLEIGFNKQLMKRKGKNGKPIGGFSLSSWQGVDWTGRGYRYQWQWSKSKWSTVMKIIKLGCIEYHRLTGGIVLATGLEQRKTFVLLVDPVYCFDAICIALLSDPLHPDRNWQWLAEIMPPPDQIGKEVTRIEL